MLSLIRNYINCTSNVVEADKGSFWLSVGEERIQQLKQTIAG